MIARTCTSTGETASAPITSRRTPSRSLHVTAVDGAISAPEPTTSSTHASSVSAKTTSVAPVVGSTVRISTARWSRDCTEIASPCRFHVTAVRYSYSSRSQSTSVVDPVAVSIRCSVTIAFGVPAAGYRFATGAVPGAAGSEMCHTSTGATSTRHATIVEPSGLHQNPRKRRISSAAMNSALPHDTVSVASDASTVAVPSASVSTSSSPRTNAIRRPSGDGCGSNTGPSTATSRVEPDPRSVTNSCPPNVNTTVESSADTA